MITMNNLFKPDHLAPAPAEFYDTSKELQYTLNSLLDEANRYNIEIQEAEAMGEAEKINIKREYLAVVNDKIDKFLLAHPEAKIYIDKN